MAAAHPTLATFEDAHATGRVRLTRTLDLFVTSDPPRGKKGSPPGDDHRID